MGHKLWNTILKYLSQQVLTLLRFIYPKTGLVKIGVSKKIHYFSFMNLKESIKHRMTEFLVLCKSHNVKNLYAFGSSISNEFNEDSSDIDLLIEIDNEDPIERGENLMNIWDNFEQFFQRKVDLLTNASIKNPVLKKNIDATKTLIYDGKEQKISI